jgi:alpha-tubulin suppressor-like RCC1 family protein
MPKLNFTPRPALNRIALRLQRRGLLACLLVAAATLAADKARADAAYTWGYNGLGQLGDGTQNLRPTPGSVPGLTNGVTAVAAGGNYSLAVQNGAVYAWGDNETGTLGDGTNLRRLLPVAVSGLTNGVTAVAGGLSHSLAVQNGGVYAWGYNGNGALGNGTTNSSTTPVAVSAPLTSGVTAIAEGNQFSLAIKNGGVWAWGVNDVGQLGDGTTTFNRTAPVAVTGLASGVTAIAAGLRHSLAVQNGGVYAWGNNVTGQLGNGTADTTGQHSTPAPVSALASGVTAVAAGKFHSLAVRNGGVYSWGANFDGDLGDGTTTAHYVPEQIDPADLHNIIAVAAGQNSSYALSSDGSLWDWGTNGRGDLGLGNTFQDNYLTPQHLLPPSGYKFTSIDVDAYGTHAIATLAALPKPGDANYDGKVDADDYFLIDRGFLSKLSGWGNGDFNGDGKVDADDYFIIDKAFLDRVTNAALEIQANPMAVPEPSTMVFVFAAIACLGRSRR